MGMTIDRTKKVLRGSVIYSEAEMWEARYNAVDIIKKYQQLKADYENRLKADLVAMLTDLQLEIEEQEPTTKNDLGVDCIVDVLGSYTDLDIPYKRKIAENILANLPSVTPQEPKTGHWIEGQTDNPNIHNILCSYCFEGYPSKGHANSQYTREKFKFCPNCGAKMIEPQESEDI